METTLQNIQGRSSGCLGSSSLIVNPFQGRAVLRKTVGSGMIRLVCVFSPPEVLRSGKTSPFVGSVTGVRYQLYLNTAYAHF